MINVDKIRKQFPIYKKNPDIKFLDTAASSLKHKDVINSLSDYLTNNGANVHRGVYKLASDATDLYEGSRSSVADFINANNNEIVFTKSTTHSINIIANAYKHILTKDDEIVISELEHHSNLLPWLEVSKETGAKVKFIEVDNGRITIENYKKVLNKNTKVVITHHISNVMGYINPIEKMAKMAHKVGAVIVVDCAQSISHTKVDVKKMDLDFIAFSGHKMYGPNGIGILYGKFNLLNNLKPFEFGGEMVDKVILNNSTFKDAPYKFEAGTPPIAEAIALKSAVDFIKKTGIKNIHNHEVFLKDYVIEKLKNESGITIFNKDSDSSIITFNIDGVHPHDTASFLDQAGVCVRAGHHCNQLTMKYLNQDSTVRASFGVYNNVDDCDTFIKTLLETRDFFSIM